MNVDPKEKMCNMDEKPDGMHPRMEKWILRKAFDTPENPYLPESVLYRQKEQFSDGVGYDWVDGLRDHANKVISILFAYFYTYKSLWCLISGVCYNNFNCLKL